MSYVDLMSNDRWSEVDHIRRTEAMVREHWSPDDEAIINRKVVGALLGQNVLTVQDQADIANFKTVTEAAQSAGIDARVDAALLNSALDIEEARTRLALIPPAPTEPDPETGELPPDDFADARAAAQAEVDDLTSAASTEVLALLDQRASYRASLNPPEPQPEEPQP